MNMNPYTAAAIFIPLSMGLFYSVESFTMSKVFDAPPVELSVEKMKELEINPKDYFLYLKYDSCVKGITAKADQTRISSAIRATCNPILSIK